MDRIDLEEGATLPPIDMLAAWFEANDWPAERVGDEEIVASAQGAWGNYELRGVWRGDDAVLQFLGFPDMRIADHQLPVIGEVLALINEQMWLGHFECWSSNGTLLYRNAVLVARDEPGLDLNTAETVIETAIDEIDRFYPVFQFVLWGGKTPKEALAAAMVDTRGEA